jgi:hypothetical protein
MVLLPGAASAASAKVAHSVQQLAGPLRDPVIPGDPVTTPGAPVGPVKTPPIVLPGPLGNPTDPAILRDLLRLTPNLTGSHDKDGHHGGDVRRNDSPDSEQLRDPHPPDHASGAVADVNLFKSRLLEITRYNATIEDNGGAHSDVTVLGLGGNQIIGASASSKGRNREGENGDALKLCHLTGDVLCVSLLYNNVVATEDHRSSLAAARGGLAALCLGGREHEATTSYECNGILSLGVAEGLGIAERDKEHGHTKADSANELLNLCLGKRDKLTVPCEGLGLQAVHSDSRSKSDKPDTERHSFLLGIDSNGRSSYLLDQPFALPIPQDCGNSALLCLFLNQGKSIIFHNPKGAGSVQEALRLDVLNRTLLVVLGQAETLVHETEVCEHGKPCKHGRPEGGPGRHEGHGHEKEGPGKGEHHGGAPELAYTGTDLAPLLAGGFLLTGLGALTVAATRRRAGKHSL